ncbi:SRPBCC family protein [uncultured Cellulomonas sp.]|uniref:SRPBCC family protein n=1 Tax=uncultured Cellulomonas sp. TaxID=189682 RepID=UPI00262385FD|nr:SRPBCC family protein [uncultured Cellulomonas sp.]
MTTKVEKSTIVDVPVSVAYAQWTQFESFPQFMSGVTSVTQLSDDRLEWVAEIAGVKRQWEAKVLEQVPDRTVSWAATSGATNAGSVTFEPAGAGQTHVHLHLEYEPEGVVETVGDKLNVVEKQAEGDLERFKSFIESQGTPTGSWQGTVNPGAGTHPGVQDAAASEGDSGKAGVSKAAVAAGVGLAAAAAGAVAAARSHGEDSTEDVAVSETAPVDTVVVDAVVTETVVPPAGGTDALPVSETGAVPGDEANQI